MSSREQEPSEQFAWVIREFVTVVIRHCQVTAAAFGMNLTDLFALSIVELDGPLGAGELAERTGLSTGATTRLIDRLENAGQVRRIADPADRRRVIIEQTPGRELDEALDAVFAPLGRGIEQLLGQYPTDRLADVMELVSRTTAALKDIRPKR